MRFGVEREDDSSYQTIAVDEVLADDNATGKGIRSHNILLNAGPSAPPWEVPESTHDLGATSANLEFNTDSDSQITIHIRSDDRDWCLLLGDSIDAQIQRTFVGGRWRLPLGRRWDMLAGLAVMVGGLALLNRFPEVMGANAAAALSTDEKVSTILEMMLRNREAMDDMRWTFMFAALPLVPFFLLSYFEPITRLMKTARRSVFLWGDMIAEHEKVQKRWMRVRWGIVIALGVPIAGSVAGDALF